MLFHSSNGSGNFGNSTPIVQYLGVSNQSTSGTISIGTPSGKRTIVIVATAYHTSGTTGFSNIQINGISCLRVNSYNISSYTGSVAIGALMVPTGTTATVNISSSTTTGITYTYFSINNAAPISLAAAINSGVPTGTSFSHSLMTSSPVKKSIIFSGISSYASGATNATSSLTSTYINSYGAYVFGSGYQSITSVNPYGLTWYAPAGQNWSSLGHTVSSLAIGF